MLGGEVRLLEFIERRVQPSRAAPIRALAEERHMAVVGCPCADEHVS